MYFSFRTYLLPLCLNLIMCANLPFCVGDKVCLSDGRSSPGDCTVAGMQYALVQSIGIVVENPNAPPACIFSLNLSGSSFTQLTLLPSAEHEHLRKDGCIALRSPCGKEYRLCRKLAGQSGHCETDHQMNAMESPQMQISMPKYMRVVHVFRLALEDSAHRVQESVAGFKENRRIGRRSFIRFKDTFTLAEWDSFLFHVKHVAEGAVICEPPVSGWYGMLEKEMRIQVVSFITLMKTLGEFDVRRFSKYLVSVRDVRRTGSHRPSQLVRVIGDYVREEPASFRRDVSDASAECLIILGATLTAVENSSFLKEKHMSVVLHRESCEWDPRERAYSCSLEVNCQDSQSLLAKLSEDTREKNRVVVSGERRKTAQQRFMGFRWCRRSRIDPRALFFDKNKADEVIGDIHVCIPSLLFFGGSTSEEILQLSKETDILQLLLSSAMSGSRKANN